MEGGRWKEEELEIMKLKKKEAEVIRLIQRKIATLPFPLLVRQWIRGVDLGSIAVKMLRDLGPLIPDTNEVNSVPFFYTVKLECRGRIATSM